MKAEQTMLDTYGEFLFTKKRRYKGHGKDLSGPIHPKLFDFQKRVTEWAIKKGRCALFLDTGLGKTFCQLEWARLIGEPTLIVAPLSVARQTVREAKKIDIDVKYIRSREEIDRSHQIHITNYEMIDRVTDPYWRAIVLDESSILKSFDGKTRGKLIRLFDDVPYRLACTATPAPNDQVELGNHTEFLGVCRQNEMLSEFFIHANKVTETVLPDGRVQKIKQSNKNGTEWRLRNYAKQDFYRWLSSWAMSMKKPSDIGFDDDGFLLPALNINPIFIPVTYKPEGKLFFDTLKGIQERGKVRRETVVPKIDKALEILLDSFGSFAINFHHGLDEKTETRIQSKVLLEPSGRTSSADSELVSCQQGQNRSGAKENVSCGILSTEQGEVQTHTGTEEEIQREQKKKISRGSGIPKRDKNKSEKLELKEPNEEEGSTSSGLQFDNSRFHQSNGTAKPFVCDMRTEREWEQENVSICGSRSQNWQSSRNSLHAMQSGDRDVQGQPQTSSQGCRLPQWVIWCGLNEEQSLFEKHLTNLDISFSSVFGSLDPDEKQQRIEDWLDGKTTILLTKPRVCGYGLNLQNAHNMLFLGLSDSWEAYYQCIRRQWRFGQTQPVNVWIILSDVERAIYENVLRKETIATGLHGELMKLVKNYELEELGQEQRMEIQNETSVYKGEKFTAYLGDSCEHLKGFQEDSIDLSVYSPPFADLYTYTATERDLGNSRSWAEFFEHYSFIIKELLRVTKIGRNTCVHTSDIPAMSMKDGYIGMRDFPGAVIQAYEKEGWLFWGRAIVTKNPQAQAIRTHSKSLLFAQLRKDSSECRPAILDHILIFKKPGVSEVPVKPTENKEMNNETWIDWAGGIWTGIQESDVLQYSKARAEDDEKHICPLQLGTIERCIKLYSNPGETVLTPFGGIGSEAYQAIRFGRKAILIELKRSYYDIAVQNLIQIEKQTESPNLFTWGKKQNDDLGMDASMGTNE